MTRIVDSIGDFRFGSTLGESILTTVFAPAAGLLAALNPGDPDIRRERTESLADLIRDFAVELDYDRDNFLGLADRLAPPLVEAAVA
jgi:hypothetical protein